MTNVKAAKILQDILGPKWRVEPSKEPEMVREMKASDFLDPNAPAWMRRALKDCVAGAGEPGPSPFIGDDAELEAAENLALHYTKHPEDIPS